MTTTNDEREVLVGRQPIFDPQLEVVAFELLFRTASGDGPGVIDGNRATSAVIVNAFTEFGLDRVVEDKRAFINLTRDFLLGENPLPLPPERVVLEVLENVAVDAQLIDGVRRLSAQGFSIALDDFVYAEKWEPLLELADIVKVEIPALGHAQIAAHLKLLRRYDVQVLAEKIETEEDFERLREMGFDLFQGYFLARPKVLKGSRIPSNRLGMLRMLAALQDPDIRMEELGRTITQDVSMCYRMLRYINSAFFALPCKVESIQQAVAYLGLNNVRRWASLIAMSGFHSRPSELLRLALVRARLSEQLAEAAGRADADVYFTLGLFSILDSLLGLPMPVILNELPLADDLQAALLTRQGPLGQALECTLSFETTDLALITYAGLQLHTIQEIYVEALAWADENGQQLW